MNAGRDVERLIADWLADEAPSGAPDRVLEAAGRTVDRTKQRRFAAAWREPVTITSSRLLIAAVIVLAAVVGAGVVGRTTANTAQQSTPTPTSTPAASNAADLALETYRSARNGICTGAMTVLRSADVSGLFDPEVTPERRTALNAAHAAVAGEVAKLPDMLAVLVPPAELAVQHAADVARQRDVAELFRLEIQLLANGKLAEAQAVDSSANAVNELRSTYESRYGLAPCP